MQYFFLLTLMCVVDGDAGLGLNVRLHCWTVVASSVALLSKVMVASSALFVAVLIGLATPTPPHLSSHPF